MKYSIIALLLCALVSFSTAVNSAPLAENTIHIYVLPGATSDRITVAVKNEDVDTIAVQMRDSFKDAHFVVLQFVADEDGWVAMSDVALEFPLSFIVTSKDHEDILLENVVASALPAAVDTGAQYTLPPSSPNAVPRRQRPSTTTTTTRRSSTTTTTTTKTPSSPSSGSAKMKLLVPLYTYPGASWTTVAAGASAVHTVAIINPNSGPGNGPDSTYKTYMTTMHNAGVEIIGYVHTSYGARAWSAVKADIDKYASEFPLVVGIFIDEASADASQVAYYTQVHNYIMSLPGYKYNVLNPGTVPTSAYLSISTQIVSYESAASSFANSANPSFANSANKDHFAVIAYGASTSQMQSALSAAKSKGYYGWVYVTDGAAGGSTYNTLTSYYAQEVAYIASL